MTEPLKDAQGSERVDLRWKQNTCPICERTFQVTPKDDYFIPACGCFDDAAPGHYPCFHCGLAHVDACLDKSMLRRLWNFVARVVLRRSDRFFVEIVDGDRLIARAEGKDAGDALIDEFFVPPVEPKP
jgi:hypothetical protein